MPPECALWLKWRGEGGAIRYLIIIIVIIVLFLLVSTALICAQGACTEAAIKEGKVELAKDTFSYMPPFGKPVTRKTENPKHG